MHHEVFAPAAGLVRGLAVGAGDRVEEGDLLLRIEPGRGRGRRRDAMPPRRPPPSDGELRDDLAAALERRRLTSDAARPAAVERRHATGLRTARENVADLCDEGTFEEYGGLAIAAQRGRRELRDLIENTPGDGIVTGIGAVNGDAVRRRAQPLRGARLRLHGPRRDAGGPKPPQGRPDDRARRRARPAGRAVRRGRRRPARRHRPLRALPPRRADVPRVRAAQRPRAAGRDRLRDGASPATPRCSAAAT